MAVAVLLVGVITSPGLAVKTAVWTHEQPKDFTDGKLENTVVTSRGEVMLARRTDTLYEADGEAEVINALARAGDGKIYAATGPKGVIYRIDGKEVTEFAVLPDGGTALSLLFAKDGKLLAGTGGGKQARIYRIDGTGKVSVFYEPKEAKYVWAMTRGCEGEVYAATGIEGRLYKIDADGADGEVLADLKPKNLLCLAIGPDAMLYTGTDGDGLIYRVDPADGKAFVMYDAAEPEISAIVLDADGNLYASTADAKGARPGRAVADKPGGKPDHSRRMSPRTQAAVTVVTHDKTGQARSRPADGHAEKKANDKSDKKVDQAESRPADGESSAPDSQPAGGKNADDGKKEEKKPTEPKKPITRTIGRSVPRTKAKDGGNVIYRIDTDGFVTEVFREPVMVLAMAEADGTIYAATGNEGRVYAVSPDDERTTMLAKLEPAQATTILRLPEGRLVVGTANDPMLIEIADRYAAEGTLVSKALDAGQIVKWGRLKWNASIPSGTTLTIATRSSNVEDEESEAWDDWSAEVDATSPQQIPSVSARFLQYRVSFATTVPDATPTFRRLQIPRIEENRAPRISSLEVESALKESKKPGSSPKVKSAAGSSGFGRSGPPPPEYNWVIKWKAADPNKDPLVYNVFYRDCDTTRWIRIAEDTKEALHIWDTRTVPDGKYEVRVVARDGKGNPTGSQLTDARISDPVPVDNTPPEVTVESVEPESPDALAVEASLTDTASRIASASYCVDSGDKWIPLAADDDIFDSQREAVSFTIDDLEPGEHRIALRVRDEQGNTRYVSRSATVGD